jgi:hypothetical protein
VFNDILGHVTQIADSFHVIKQAKSKVDECRRPSRRWCTVQRPGTPDAARPT